MNFNVFYITTEIWTAQIQEKGSLLICHRKKPFHYNPNEWKQQETTGQLKRPLTHRLENPGRSSSFFNLFIFFLFFSFLFFLEKSLIFPWIKSCEEFFFCFTYPSKKINGSCWMSLSECLHNSHFCETKTDHALILTKERIVPNWQNCSMNQSMLIRGRITLG